MKQSICQTTSAPHQELPEYLQGLELPTTKDDAIVHAAEHGASSEVLEFMERLPAAVFASDAGLRHAFSNLDQVALDELVGMDEGDLEEDDGISS